MTIDLLLNKGTVAVNRQCQDASVSHVSQDEGGHKVGEKNSSSFPGFSRAISLLCHRLSQQKVNVILTFIKDHDDPDYPVNSCVIQIFE